MGLFSKRPELDDDDDLPRVLPAAQKSSPPPARGKEVSVKAADPNQPPAQTIERHKTADLVEKTVLDMPNPTMAPPAPTGARFSIDEAVRLLRELPGKDNGTVRAAVQRTLEFLHVDLARLVDDGAAKDLDLERRIAGLAREVEQHEALALAAKKQIQQLQLERTELEATTQWILEQRRTAAPQGEQPIVLERIRGNPTQG